MINPGPSLKLYLRRTNTSLFSYLMALPLFICYELLMLMTRPSDGEIVRIAVDAWIKYLFSTFDVNILALTLLLFVLLGMVIFYKERSHLSELNWKYFYLMFFEAIAYAVILLFLISGMITQIFNLALSESIESLSVLQQFTLSLGAGLYEELFFRLILVSAGIWIFSKLLDKRWAGGIAAVVLSAFIFSIAHYTGSLGEAFTFTSFTFRLLFGIALSAIYLLRGFGMAAWTHAIYDIIVLLVI